MKSYGHKTFKINRNLEAQCYMEDTRYGFRHLASLYYKNQNIADAKCCYYNRTWEAYEFQSVLEKLADNVTRVLSPRQVRNLKKYIENYHERDSFLNTISMVAKMGAILAPDQKSKNDFRQLGRTFGGRKRKKT